MTEKVGRRNFLAAAGAGVAGLVVGGVAGSLLTPTRTQLVEKTVTAGGATVEKTVTVAGGATTVVRTVTVTGTARPPPTTPIKFGAQYFHTGGGALLGLPGSYGLQMAIKEVNEAGGVMGRRIELLERDEGSTDATVREFRKLVLEDKIDYYFGLISSGNTPAVGPEAEENRVLTLFTDGCTDILFEQAIPNPKYVFRITNIQSSDAITNAVGAVKLLVETGKLKENPRITGIHPDYAYGRLINDFGTLAFRKMLPNAEILDPQFVPLFQVQDFSAQITSLLAQNPDLIWVSLWGGDYVNFYKQSVGYGLYQKAYTATTLAFGGSPQAVGKDHPPNQVTGVHANYWFTYPDWTVWPMNKTFSEKFFQMWKEWPSFEGEGAYTSVYMWKAAVEKAAQNVKGYPDHTDVIPILENLGYYGPAGYIQIRKKNHQAYKNAVTGVGGPVDKYDFLAMTKVLSLPIEQVSASAEYPTSKSWLESWPVGYRP
ncbi:MAG: ABC transporter substrate-binding protein [Candidatus Caldarchaeum sp.]